jgi:uncharacterized protein (DUF927 family)
MLGDRPRKFRAVGDLKLWRKAVRRFATGQPLVTFLLAAALTSMILRRLKIQPFVILLHAESSVVANKFILESVSANNRDGA